MNSYLFVDHSFAQDCGIEEAIFLFPRPGRTCDWLIPHDKQVPLTREILSLRDDLAGLFAREIYSPILGYSQEACELLFLNCGNLLAFLLCDRAFRLNRLLLAQKEIVLPEVGFSFDPDTSYENLYYNEIEQNPAFNQWVINRILSDFTPQKLPSSPRSVRKELVKHHASGQPSPSIPEILSRKVKTFCRLAGEKDTLKKISRILLDHVHSRWTRFRRHLSACGSRIAWDGLGPVSLVLQKETGFLWPSGPLCLVPDAKLPETPSQTIPRDAFRQHRESVADRFRAFFDRLDEPLFLNRSHFLALADLLVDLLPRITTENAPESTRATLAKLDRFRGKSYFAAGHLHNHHAALRAFACRELGIRIISTQHSAWGGYLANGPLVTEVLIKGSDDYITFGWKEKPDDGSGWLNQCLRASSPLLSELRSRSYRKKRSSGFKRKILFCPGFIYRFPAIYNSSLRVDTLADWSSILEEVIGTLAAAGYGIEIKMYDRVMAENMAPYLKDWLAAGKGFAHESPDHDARVRIMMGSESFEETYDAVVWDIPAGGFTEAIACGRRSFALWNERILKALPEGVPHVLELQEAGVFFSNGSQLLKSLESIREAPDWFESPEVNRPVQSFMNHFVKLDPEWRGEWRRLIKGMERYA